MFKRAFCVVFLLILGLSSYGQYNPIGANQISGELIGRVLFGETPWNSEDILNPSVTGVTNSFCARYSNFTINNETENIQDDNPLNTVYFRHVLRGNSYTISIKGDKCISGTLPYTRGVKVFADWNKDFDFNDVGEVVWTSNSVSSSTPEFSTTITVPSYAVTDTIRMRVVYARIMPGLMSFLWPRTIPPIFEAETPYNYGETEDYDLVVLGLIDTIDVMHESCPEANDGVVTIIPELTAPIDLQYSITSIVGPWSESPVFTGLTAGNYTVWAMDPSTGEVDSDNIIINSASSCFDIDAGIDLLSCEGDSIQLNGEVITGANYLWTPSSGINNPNISNPTVLPNTTTTYILEVDSAGQIATDSVTVYVYPYPVFSVSEDQSLCAGDVPSDLVASYIPGANYSWTPSTELNNTNFNQVSFNSAINDTITYIVSVDLSGCVATDSILVLQNPVPNSTLSVIPNPVCFGDEITLNASASIPVLYYRFQYNDGSGWQLITNPGWSTNNSLTFNINTTTNFRVRTIENWGCTVSPWSPIITVPVIDLIVDPIIHN